MNYGYTDEAGVLLAYDTTDHNLTLEQAQAIIPEIAQKHVDVPYGLKIRYADADVKLSPRASSYHQLIGGDWIEITDLRGMKFLKCARVRERAEAHIAEFTFSYAGKEFRLDIPKKTLYNSVMLASIAGALTVPIKVQSKYYESIQLDTIPDVQAFWGSAVVSSKSVYDWMLSKCEAIMEAPFESSVNAIAIDDLP